jgi:cyclohexanecarboxylate-CoA ligase
VAAGCSHAFQIATLVNLLLAVGRAMTNAAQPAATAERRSTKDLQYRSDVQLSRYRTKPPYIITNGATALILTAAHYRQRGWWRDQTFLDDLRRDVDDDPAKAAIIAYRARGATTRVLSYAQLSQLTGNFAAALVSLGVKVGDTVAVQLPSWWELLPLGLACARVGARFCPLMTIYRRYELAHILRLTGARVCITVPEWGGARLADIVAGLAGELPQLEHIVVADTGSGGDRPAGTLSFDEHFLAAPPAGSGEQIGSGAAGQQTDFSDRELGPDEPFLILFTSGTTGEAKGVMHSQNTLYAGISAYVEVLGMDSSVVSFVSHAATHYTGFVQGMLIPVMLGCTAIVEDVWDPDKYLDLAQQHGVTTFYGSPPYLAEVLAAQRAKPRDMSSLRCVVTGSAPVPPSIVDQVRDVLGAPVVALWGMSENGPVTMTRLDDPAGWAAHSDGRPIDCMQIRIEVPAVPDGANGSGKLWVRGACQCLGYYQRAEDYAAALDQDGWFDTGDLARDDGRGGMRISGRVKDIVIHRGFNVPVAEVEGILARHPQIREMAVIGVPDGDIDELVCAVLVPDGQPPDLAGLREYINAAGVSEQFWPDRVEVVDALPRTITGKVRKIELRQRFGGA